jgi:glucose-1-phosphate cytidylyltransferase
MNNNNLTSVIILVGGSGSRFSKLNEQPKQLSKLNNDLILMHIIKNFKKYGLNHFIFPLGIKKNFFIKFFNSTKNKDKYKFNILDGKNKKDYDKDKVNITYFDAGRNTTKLTRVYKSLKYIMSDDLLVAYGDDLSDIRIDQLFKKFLFFKKRKALITIFKKNSQYGHVMTDKRGNVKKFVEKPAFQNPINIGHYLFSANLLKKIKSKKYELESYLIPLLVKKNLLYSHEHKGYFYSINDKKELIFAKKKLKKLKI